MNIDEYTQGTDPNIQDSDDDWLLDGEEVHTHLTNPLLRDTDADRMTDGWEITYNLDPLVSSDGLTDLDNDGFANYEEFFLLTEPDNVNDFATSQPWSTYQGNANHDGFVVFSAQTAQISELWRVDLGLHPHQVIAANGNVFVTNNSYSGSHKVQAFNSASGSLSWEISYEGIHSLNPPAYASGSVFYQTGGHGDSFLRSVNANTGTLEFESSYGNQWSNYLAPTPFEGKIYIAGGYYGGTYAFDENGNEIYFNSSLPQIDDWTPTVDTTRVYACTSGTLNILDRASGQTLNTISSNNTENWTGCSNNTTVVKGSLNNLIAVNSNSLQSLNLATNQVNWIQEASYTGQVSMAYGLVYVIRNGVLSVLDEFSGDLVWSFEATSGGSFNSNIVLSRNFAFISNSSRTFAIDLDTHLSVWSAEVSGQLSLSEGVLYVAGNQQLVAFNVDGDDDNDGIPNWWEINYGMNPDDPSDATMDTDVDGVTNLEEYLQSTNPIVADTDEDGLSDGDEINIYNSNPLNTDSDSDGLNDGEEVNTYGTDPMLIDTDGDSFSDGDEVHLYGTDPADANSIPEALTNLVESFEGNTIPGGWSISQSSNADWFITTDQVSDGTQSLRSGDIGDNQESSIELTGLFAAGTFSFDMLVSSESCCDSLELYLDDAIVSRFTSQEWNSYAFEIEAGQHTIKFRYEKDGSISSGEDAAWIDNINFVQ